MITLYEYQKEYLKHVKPNFFYDCDTRTGKTFMALAHHRKYFADKKLLVVAPASKINEGGWQRTIEQYYSHIIYDTCSYNMLSKKYKEYEDWFVIFDERTPFKKFNWCLGKSWI